MKISETPEYGTRRKRTEFLFFPGRFPVCETGENCGRYMTLWLESVDIEEEWKPDPWWEDIGRWVFAGMSRK